MTKIITRLFESAETARAVAEDLKRQHRFPPSIVSTYTSTDGLADKLMGVGVKKKTAKAYADRVENGGGVVLVRAGYKPLGVAGIARRVMADSGAADMGDVTEEVEVKDAPSGGGDSILSNHPLLMTVPRRSNKRVHMAEWPIPLIIRRRPRDRSLSVRINTITGRILPLLSRRKPADNFAFRRHARMANWPIGLLVPGHKYMANFPFGHIVPGHKHYAKFPFDHLVPGHKYMANFPFGHIVPGHRHMANWPFPLLIDGEEHTTSLIPGHKYQANWPFGHLIPGHKLQAGFPFGHIVPGHKYMAKFPFAHIVPGHKHMAGFPFGHIVPGHKHYAKFPFDHLVPGHKYMANWILPHTRTKSGAAASEPNQ